MRRTTSLTTSLGTTTLVGLALLSPTGAAAAGETCRGEAATIVGTTDTVTGTEGRDVIVSGKALEVRALGGDDLVCIVPDGTRANGVDVDAGAGADVVDSTGSPSGYYVRVILGTGADTLVGGPSGESVTTGHGSTLVDGDRDVVDTGAEYDSVITGSPSGASNDRVDTGPGDDRLTLATGSFAADALLTGGEGRDLLIARGVTGDISLDMSTGTLTAGGGTAAFSQLEAAELTVGSQRVTYRGTPDADSLTVHARDGVPTVDVTTLAGDDFVVVEPAAVAAGSSIDAGDGRDSFTTASHSARLAIHLRRDVLEIDGLTVPAAGFEDASLHAPEVEMVGDDADNRLEWDGCDATLRGGNGDDDLANRYDSFFETYTFDCATGVVSVNGGDGSDSLRGSFADDRLIGGRGHDRLEGRNGNDRLRGGRGNDDLDGGERRDNLSGGRGRDDLLGRGSGDTLIGGGGRDRADGSRGGDLCRAERERRCER